jgi:hypothetical protein
LRAGDEEFRRVVWEADNPYEIAKFPNIDGKFAVRKYHTKGNAILAITIPESGGYELYFMPQVHIEDNRPQYGITQAVYNLPLLSSKVRKFDDVVAEYMKAKRCEELDNSSDQLVVDAVKNTRWLLRVRDKSPIITIGRVKSSLPTASFYESGAAIDSVMRFGDGLREILKSAYYRYVTIVGNGNDDLKASFHYAMRREGSTLSLQDIRPLVGAYAHATKGGVKLSNGP